MVVGNHGNGFDLERLQTGLSEMSGALDKYLGIVLVAVVLFYFFRDARGTANILQGLSDFNVKAITALQGGYARGGV